jgi:hypothetical protein
MKKVLLASMALLFVLGACKKSDDDNNNDTQGTTTALQNKVTVTEADGLRKFESNNIPDHTVGTFPNSGNPFTLQEIEVKRQMPLAPTQLNTPLITTGYEFGLGINGVVMDPNGPFYIEGREQYAIQNPFEGLASGWQYEAVSQVREKLGLDLNEAHLQPPGLYHYHGYPQEFVKVQREKQLGAGKTGMVLLGYAADGYPIYNETAPSVATDLSSALKTLKSSYRLKSGERPVNPESKPKAPTGAHDGTYVQDYEYVAGLGDLDACNGRTGVTKEYPNGTYYYVITSTWPYIPRYFRGKPDESFRILPPDGTTPPPPQNKRGSAEHPGHPHGAIMWHSHN